MTFIEGQCGAHGTPHRLRSSVLAGRDNYTAVWNKVCIEADSSYAAYSIEPKCPERQRTMTVHYPARRMCKITTTISCMFLSG